MSCQPVQGGSVLTVLLLLAWCNTTGRYIADRQLCRQTDRQTMQHAAQHCTVSQNIWIVQLQPHMDDMTQFDSWNNI